jgi:Uma2 family endonuclease
MKKVYNADTSEDNAVKEPTVDFGKTYTYADYLKFEMDEMVELIRGKIFKMSPAPKINHQQINGNLSGIFYILLRDKTCKYFQAPTDVVLPIKNLKRNKATTVVQPDLFIVCNEEIIEEGAVFGVPDMVAEIVAGTNIKKDAQIKFELYEEAGVKEYWIILADVRAVQVFVLQDGRYQFIKTYSDDDIIPLNILPDYKISFNDIFDRVEKKY